MRFTCPVCGRIGADGERRCPEHAARDDNRQQVFRAAVLQRDRERCRRCGATGEPMIAAHWPIPLHALTTGDQYDPRLGVTLCRACHRLMDPHAS